MTSVRIQVAGDREHLDQAAAIWAEATAARDGDAEIAPLSVARPLLQRVAEGSPRSLLLAAAGFTGGELAVYRDNSRAVKLYEGLGWRPVGDAQPHPRSGRPEQRYRLAF